MRIWEASRKPFQWVLMTLCPRTLSRWSCERVLPQALNASGCVISKSGISIRYNASPMQLKCLKVGDMILASWGSIDIAGRGDGLGKLASVFARMAQEIYDRELTLRTRVSALGQSYHLSGLAMVMVAAALWATVGLPANWCRMNSVCQMRSMALPAPLSRDPQFFFSRSSREALQTPSQDAEAFWHLSHLGCPAPFFRSACSEVSV